MFSCTCCNCSLNLKGLEINASRSANVSSLKKPLFIKLISDPVIKTRAAPELLMRSALSAASTKKEKSSSVSNSQVNGQYKTSSPSEAASAATVSKRQESPRVIGTALQCKSFLIIWISG